MTAAAQEVRRPWLRAPLARGEVVVDAPAAHGEANKDAPADLAVADAPEEDENTPAVAARVVEFLQPD